MWKADLTVATFFLAGQKEPVDLTAIDGQGPEARHAD